MLWCVYYVGEGECVVVYFVEVEGFVCCVVVGVEVVGFDYVGVVVDVV